MHNDSQLTHRTFWGEWNSNRESSNKDYSNVRSRMNIDSHENREVPSKEKLIRSTKRAWVIALIILVIFVLPAEYWIDITGIWNLIGLKEMWKIKMSLKRDMEKINAKKQEELTKKSQENTVDESLVAQNVDTENTTNSNDTEDSIPTDTQKTASTTIPAQPQNTSTSNQKKTDKIVVKILPDESTEIKAVMKQGQEMVYNRYVDAWHLNYNMHAEWDNGESAEYGDWRQLPKEEWKILAEFNWKHGWFFRNRSWQEVTLTLEVNGSFEELKQVF